MRITGRGIHRSEKRTERKNSIKLKDEPLEEVSGGFLYIYGECALEVINSNSNVVATCASPNARRDAHKKCEELGLSI